MRSEQEMMNLILSIAKKDDRIGVASGKCGFTTLSLFS
ncbi:TPA: aminoglycoside 6-adenylyltransferase [Enterococcus faecium]|nr:aminoglycoside 6-adenylyltransferase [Enterococcus faecium]HAQ9445376.1 aminoglycoside 6-adenylyltransferase [Enterococcus faecium]